MNNQMSNKMSNQMSAATCSADKEKLTVGEHTLLTCSGNTNSVFLFEESIEKLTFKLSEENKYTLKVFKAKSLSPGQISLDFTIYSPGDYKISDFILTDGTSEVSLSGPVLKVESVIKQPSDGKPAEPFGPILPISIATPVYYYLLLTAFILSGVVYAIFKAKRLSYYRKLKEKLNDYNSPVAPDTQFYKSIRIAEKTDYPLEQIEKAFRLYNLRAYQLPLFELTNERILRYFKRNFPQYKSTRSQLIKLLGELEDMQKHSHTLTLMDKQEFIKRLYRYVEANKGLTE